MLPYKSIQERLQAAVKSVLPDADIESVLVRPCPDPKFGDYQTNALMGLAKARRLNPRQVANDVLARLDVAEWCEKVEIAGAGFLNFRLTNTAVAKALGEGASREELFLEKSSRPRTVVIDFSSPNVAKPMHVGHIRSTILGDSLVRVLRLLGHKAIADNHIGDWGTQFGMLLVGWKHFLDQDKLRADPLAEMERIYKLVSGRCDAEKPGFDAATLEEARAELVKLQAGDPANLAIWREMIRLSQGQFESIYGRLDVRFDYTLGESYYNPQLQAVVEDLMKRRIARESRGAKAVFSDGSLPPKEDPFLIHREGEWVPNPFIIQKQDGAFNYATTDLATIAHRVFNWHADEVVYVTDGRQQLHFRQLFATFRRWHPEARTKLAHVWFGSILGEDGKPFKTRSGETVRLSELLDEAEERAFKVVTEKSPDFAETDRRQIARIVGIGAVKYADLLPNRQTDYVFSWDKMLALNGNTAPYLQYAYVSIQGIFRKGNIQEQASIGGTKNCGGTLLLEAPQEITLAKHLLNFDLVLEAVAEEYRPNFLCNYLYELAADYFSFNENCPVLKSAPAQRESRLLLCEITARVLKLGLHVLGIDVLDKM